MTSLKDGSKFEGAILSLILTAIESRNCIIYHIEMRRLLLAVKSCPLDIKSQEEGAAELRVHDVVPEIAVL